MSDDKPDPLEFVLAALLYLVGIVSMLLVADVIGDIYKWVIL